MNRQSAAGSASFVGSRLPQVGARASRFVCAVLSAPVVVCGARDRDGSGQAGAGRWRRAEHRALQPCGVRIEVPGRDMAETGALFQVADRDLDDGVTAMAQIHLDCGAGEVGEKSMVSPVRPQRAYRRNARLGVVEQHRKEARLALSLVRGLVENTHGAHEILLDAFDDVAHAAVCHAYMSGFLLQALAEQRRESPSETAAWIGTLLAET